jgi:hypothetical protein
MKIAKVTAETDLKKGDLLLVEGPISGIVAYTIKQVKGFTGDKEIILNVRKNTWFSLNKYLARESWAKDVRIVLAK